MSGTVENPPEIFVYALGGQYVGCTINRLVNPGGANVSDRYKVQMVLVRNIDELNSRVIATLVQQYGMTQEDAESLVPGSMISLGPMTGGSGDVLYLPLTGGQMQGPIALAADPVSAMEAATQQYVISNTGLSDAPSDGATHGRLNGNWSPTATLADIPAASTTPPVQDGTANPGAAATFSRGDHTHPTDVSRYAASNPAGYQSASQVTTALGPYALKTSVPGASSTVPAQDGAAAIGTSTAFARADHIHPVDSSRYAASNPSNYQTDVQLTAALAPYLPRTGVVDGSNAPTGQIGEYLANQTLSTAAIPLTTNVATGVTTLALTAGDWDVWGSVGFTLSANNTTTLRAWINPTGAASAPSIDQAGGYAVMAVANNITQTILPVTPMRISLTSPVTIRLGTTCTSAGSISAWGSLMARRVR